MTRRRRRHRLGRVPSMPWACRTDKRTAAARLVRNVLRAVEMGKCTRARTIINDWEYTEKMACVPNSVISQVHQKVQRCTERRSW